MRRLLSHARAHPVRALSASVVVVVVATGAFLGRDLIGLALAADEPIDHTLPIVEPLSPARGEVVYRIDASRSEVRVDVDEHLAGVRGTVELTTRGIAGDIGVRTEGPASLRLCDVVVDVHQLRSDNSLRDKALRHDHLESHSHRFVRLEDARVTLPEGAGSAAGDRSVEGAVLEGSLEVKDTRRPTSWDVSAEVRGDTLTATATTTVLMSEFGVGPINKVGLVRTEDEVDLTISVVAVDGRSFTPPVGLAADPVEVVAASSGPSFSSQIQPILEQNCAGCHRSGAIGASMWTLDTAGDAAEIADGLAVVTGSGYMPPWPASEVGVPVRHARGLGEDEIAAIAQWARAGAELDVPADTAVAAPDQPEVELPRADRVVQLAEPYTGSPDEPDDYRCFVLDPEIDRRSFLTGYTFDPDRIEIVHHAIVYRVRAEDRAGVEAKDAADPGSGWSCFAGMGADQGQRIAGWVPGQRPLTLDDGEGFEFLPDDVLVAQIHYHYHDEASAVPDRSGMTLQFDDDTGDITALQSRTLIGPVELPCPAGVTAPLCDRDAALVDVGERFGLGAIGIANGLNRLCRTTPEELAATSDGVTANTTCDHRIAQGGEVIGMLGHLHELGASYRMTLNPDTPDERVLLDIPVWNFGWQLNYRPVDDVPIARGDVIRVTCSWDRRLRHDPEPRHIVFAEGTGDEMCFSTLTVRPDATEAAR